MYILNTNIKHQAIFKRFTISDAGMAAIGMIMEHIIYYPTFQKCFDPSLFFPDSRPDGARHGFSGHLHPRGPTFLMNLDSFITFYEAFPKTMR